ncbi:Cytochrome c peroxidase, mitochondrial [Lachnellula subtilissima]|uniref:Peroxidase n=1 Tax=Lachnellula subtilissima TaxID=602034 RepID=A0A8H8RKS7_9HELO|nr:Cytochrome c peroxidase, mitochondrial [Lachnellula subtilissima]
MYATQFQNYLASSWAAVLYLAAVGAIGYYLCAKHALLGLGNFKPTKEEYQKVYNEIASRLEEDYHYDDGSYGPILVRLAWHASGTYDTETDTGGSNGATMRVCPESLHGANAGLDIARNFLEDVKTKFPWITYADLWILGGVAAIQEMEGPIIPFRPGRKDRDSTFSPPDGRLPDASQGAQHLRNIFNRMGFNDQEIVALSGAHSLGRCHTDRLGFDGPWTYTPSSFSNQYYVMLTSDFWKVRNWDGPRQFQGSSSQTLMMLPTDLALVQDEMMKPWVEKYANDSDLFFHDFSNVLLKLFELGVPFEKSTERWTFTPTKAQKVAI